jgi:hypothetical protein
LVVNQAVLPPCTIRPDAPQQSEFVTVRPDVRDTRADVAASLEEAFRVWNADGDASKLRRLLLSLLVKLEGSE